MKYLLCNYIKKCYERGWISPRDGNVSYRPAGMDFCYITPTALRKHEINNDDIVKINLDYKNSKYSVVPNAQRQPSGELGFHTGLMFRPEWRDRDICVVHCHPPHITAFVGLLQSDRELQLLNDLFPELTVKIGANVPHIDARTPKLASAVLCNLQGVDIIALKQHGIVAIGHSFQEAMEIIETCEYYARIALLERPN